MSALDAYFEEDGATSQTIIADYKVLPFHGLYRRISERGEGQHCPLLSFEAVDSNGNAVGWKMLDEKVVIGLRLGL